MIDCMKDKKTLLLGSEVSLKHYKYTPPCSQALREELSLPSEVLVAGSLEEALALASEPRVAQVFVIGGGSVYAEAVTRPVCLLVSLTLLFLLPLNVLSP